MNVDQLASIGARAHLSHSIKKDSSCTENIRGARYISISYIFYQNIFTDIRLSEEPDIYPYHIFSIRISVQLCMVDDSKLLFKKSLG